MAPLKVVSNHWPCNLWASAFSLSHPHNLRFCIDGHASFAVISRMFTWVCVDLLQQQRYRMVMCKCRRSQKLTLGYCSYRGHPQGRFSPRVASEGWQAEPPGELAPHREKIKVCEKSLPKRKFLCINNPTLLNYPTHFSVAFLHQ